MDNYDSVIAAIRDWQRELQPRSEYYSAGTSEDTDKQFLDDMETAHMESFFHGIGGGNI